MEGKALKWSGLLLAHVEPKTVVLSLVTTQMYENKLHNYHVVINYLSKTVAIKLKMQVSESVLYSRQSILSGNITPTFV